MAFPIEADFGPGTSEITKLAQALAGHVRARGRRPDLKVAAFADSSALRAGDPVVFV